MGDLPVYLPVEERQVLERAINEIDYLLRKHYRQFINSLIIGVLLILIGMGVMLLYPIWGLLPLVVGVVIILLSSLRKVYIERLDISIYPILSLPYSDMKNSLLIDVLGKGGEEVSIKISRLEKINNELEKLIGEMKKISQMFEQGEIITSDRLFIEEQKREGVNSQETGETRKEIPELLEIGVEGEPVTGLERLISDILEKTRETLKARGYDEFSFKLFKPSFDLELYPSKIIIEKCPKCIPGDISIEEYAIKVDNVLESLKTRYLDALDSLDAETNRVISIALRLYGEASEVLLARVEALHKYMLDKLNARLCSRCAREETGNIIATGSIPLLEKQYMWHETLGDIISYDCKRCGARHAESVMDIGLVDRSKGVVRVPFADILEFKAWRYIYVNNLVEINRIISEARSRKREKMFEAIRSLHSIYDQMRTQLIPIYIQLSRSYYEIEALRNAIGNINVGASIREFASCVNEHQLEFVKYVINDAKKFVGISTGEEEVQSIIQSYIEEIKEYSTLKIASVVFDETIIDMLVQSLSDKEADEVRRAYYEENSLDKILDLIETKKSRGE